MWGKDKRRKTKRGAGEWTLLFVTDERCKPKTCRETENDIIAWHTKLIRIGRCQDRHEEKRTRGRKKSRKKGKKNQF